MYQPTAFAVTDPAEIEAVLATLRLGCLVTHGFDGFCATHMPFHYEPARRLLTGHIARANPHWARAGDTMGLALFQDADAYVSPSWYPSKQQHGKVVPTWNYVAVHVHGRLTWRHEADWLIAQVSALSDKHEATRPAPWAVSDAPEDYIRNLAGAIVGIELAIDRVEVTRKLSQNRSASDRSGVIAGLADSPRDTDRALASLMTDANPG